MARFCGRTSEGSLSEGTALESLSSFSGLKETRSLDLDLAAPGLLTTGPESIRGSQLSAGCRRVSERVLDWEFNLDLQSSSGAGSCSSLTIRFGFLRA